MKKQLFAECLGTFTLSFMVLLSITSGSPFPLPTALLAGITLGLFVYTIGGISGCHINPAVTIGVWSIGKIKGRRALYYILAQVGGALIAVLLVRLILLQDVTVALASVGTFKDLVAETIGTFFFTFGIASVVFERTPSVANGFVIGASLLFGISFAAFLGSGGVLNPAVAMSLNSVLKGGFSFVYIVGPIIGSVAGMNAYKALI